MTVKIQHALNEIAVGKVVCSSRKFEIIMPWGLWQSRQKNTIAVNSNFTKQLLISLEMLALINRCTFSNGNWIPEFKT